MRLVLTIWKLPKIGVKKAGLFRNFMDKSCSILMQHKIGKHGKCFFNKKKIIKIPMIFFLLKIGLKSRFWHFLTAIFDHWTAQKWKSILKIWPRVPLCTTLWNSRERRDLKVRGVQYILSKNPIAKLVGDKREEKWLFRLINVTKNTFRIKTGDRPVHSFHYLAH